MSQGAARSMFALAVVVSACDAGSRQTTRDAGALAMLDVSLVRAVSPAVTTGEGGVLRYAWVTLDSSGRGHLFTMTEGKAPRELMDSVGPPQFDGETPPKLQTAPDGSLMLSYALSVPDSTAKYKSLSGLRFTRSSDGGNTWSPAVTVADNGDLGRYRNDHTMHIARDGKVYLAWLDERVRDTARVYVARSDDHGATWTRNVAIDLEEACGCCRTPITTGPDGSVYTVWRKLLPGGLRDMVIARSVDGGATWTKPVRVYADSFAINSCPDAGPSIAVDDANRLHVSWWTGRQGAAGVKYAYSDNGGRTFSEPAKLGVAEFSKGAHPQLLIADSARVAVTWDDGTTSPPRIALRVTRNRGATFDSTRYISTPGTSASFPVLAVTGGRIVVLCQEKGVGRDTVVSNGVPPTHWRAYNGNSAVRLVRYEAQLP